MNTQTIKRLTVLAQALWCYKRRDEECSYLPISLWVEPTNICNLRCIMCPSNASGKKKGYMDFNLFKKIVDEAQAFVHNIYLFLGGESLLHPHLCEMVKYAKSYDIRLQLNTNATLLTGEKAINLLETGIDSVVFSFEGYDKETYERIRVNADFDETLHNITNFLAKKKEMGLDKPSTTLQVIEFDSLFGKTRSQRAEFRKRFQSLPLNRFSFIKPHNFGGKIEGVAQKDYRPKGNVYSPCTFLWYSMSVLWDGTIVPCCLDLGGAYSLGTVADMSLAEAWNGERMRALRRKIASQENADIELCASCDVLWKRQFAGMPIRELGDLWTLLK
jgi:radical SAM protein with 4Fe4S-binding SPASM domain